MQIKTKVRGGPRGCGGGIAIPVRTTGGVITQIP
ncbi:hypothetical protein SAMN05443572_110194 [Myxococcus fulvus]|uniref:Lipoprotein n=1 Tax=Myxococcus fulvus TaxID=33 RepID=A0ABY1CS02_MYXFU|nr:hypothetical protein SAMN05443572_110194 [Myxococcus fulvus]